MIGRQEARALRAVKRQRLRAEAIAECERRERALDKRNAEVMRRLAHGLDAKTIAQEFGLTRQRIYQIFWQYKMQEAA